MRKGSLQSRDYLAVCCIFVVVVVVILSSSSLHVHHTLVNIVAVLAEAHTWHSIVPFQADQCNLALNVMQA